MTLDEAIKHAEEAAKDQKELYMLCPASEYRCDGTKDCKALKNGKNKGCQKCVEEHKQLAEWLKDYKRLLEQDAVPFDFELYQAGLMDMPKEMFKVLDQIRAEIEQERIGYPPSADYYKAIMKCLQIIDKYATENEDEA